MNVWSYTVKNNICIGCELCETLCNAKCISFDDNKLLFDSKKCIECGLCVRYCPSISSNRNDIEESLEERMHGKYLNAYTGRIKDLTLLRKTVSGGFVTKTICELLKKNVYDFAVGVDTVSINKKVEMKVYDLSTYSDSIPGSVYIMPSYKKVIQYINANSDKKGIIVGCGCIVKTIKNIIKESKKLSDDNYLFLGLFCDATLKYDVCNYLSRLGGKEGDLCTGIEFRSKIKSGWPGDIFLKTVSGGISIPREERYKIVDLFKNRRCMLCLDHMNTYADISIGDNYTGEHTDLLGSNSIVIRTNKGASALNFVKDELILYDVEYEKICESQGLKKKRVQFITSKYFAKKTGIEINPKINVEDDCGVDIDAEKNARIKFRNKTVNGWLRIPLLVSIITICKKMSSIENRFIAILEKKEIIKK